MKARLLSHLVQKERTAITEYVTRIQQRFADLILAVVLFGSKARGEGDAESDIDLLVLVKDATHAPRSELWRIAFDVSLEYNVVLSPRVFDEARWAETRRIRVPLYRAIATDSIYLTPEPVPSDLFSLEPMERS